MSPGFDARSPMVVSNILVSVGDFTMICYKTTCTRLSSIPVSVWCHKDLIQDHLHYTVKYSCNCLWCHRDYRQGHLHSTVRIPVSFPTSLRNVVSVLITTCVSGFMSQRSFIVSTFITSFYLLFIQPDCGRTLLHDITGPKHRGGSVDCCYWQPPDGCIPQIHLSAWPYHHWRHTSARLCEVRWASVQ